MSITTPMCAKIRCDAHQGAHVYHQARRDAHHGTHVCPKPAVMPITAPYVPDSPP